MKKILLMVIIIIITVINFAFQAETGIHEGIFPYFTFKFNLPFSSFLSLSYTNAIIPENPDDSIIFRNYISTDSDSMMLMLCPLTLDIGFDFKITHINDFDIMLNLSVKAVTAYPAYETIIPAADTGITVYKETGNYKTGINLSMVHLFYYIKDFEKTQTYFQYLFVPKIGLVFLF